MYLGDFKNTSIKTVSLWLGECVFQMSFPLRSRTNLFKLLYGMFSDKFNSHLRRKMIKSGKSVTINLFITTFSYA